MIRSMEINRLIYGLQLTLGLVLIAMTLPVIFHPDAARNFARYGADWVRLSLGWSEVVACLLFLWARTFWIGAWGLLAVFLWAILLHVLGGDAGGSAGLIPFIFGVLAVMIWKNKFGHRAAGGTAKDQEFIAAFESGKLPPECFRHQDHVKLAWLYLRQYSLIPT